MPFGEAMLLAQIATQLGSIRRVVVSRHYHGEWTFLPLWVRHRYHGGFTDAGMSDGWMRGEKPHRYIGNSITPRLVASQIARV